MWTTLCAVGVDSKGSIVQLNLALLVVLLLQKVVHKSSKATLLHPFALTRLAVTRQRYVTQQSSEKKTT